MKNCRNISKRDMINNDALPRVEVDPETYEVRADGELLTCEPASDFADGAALFPVLSGKTDENFSSSAGDRCGFVASER